MARIIDSHAHYDDARFDSEIIRDDIIAELEASGEICGRVNAGTNLETSKRSIALSERYPFFYATVGIHPHDAEELSPSDEETVIDELKALAAHRKVVAIGEIGLDFHYDEADTERQTFWFHRQMELARELSLPVVIHDREAHGAVMDIIRSYPEVKGILHSFSGSRETAAELIRMGWYISFSGVITFKNAQRAAEVVKSIPLDRLLIETDCPYLAPHPMRGKCNHSGYLRYTAAKAAELLGVSNDELCAQTVSNACTVYNITDIKA